MKNSDTVLTTVPKIYVKGKQNETIVVTNEEDNPVLIFPKNAVSREIQDEDDATQIDLYIQTNRGQEVLYKFGFSTLAQVMSLNILLRE